MHAAADFSRDLIILFFNLFPKISFLLTFAKSYSHKFHKQIHISQNLILDNLRIKKKSLPILIISFLLISQNLTLTSIVIFLFFQTHILILAIFFLNLTPTDFSKSPYFFPLIPFFSFQLFHSYLHLLLLLHHHLLSPPSFLSSFFLSFLLPPFLPIP